MATFRYRNACTCLTLLAIFALALTVYADSKTSEGKSLFNFPMKTMGGKQFWGDERIFGKWRVQQNSLTGHYRLLDATDVRRAWGDLDACNAALDEAVASGKAFKNSDKLCVLIHGYLRTHDSLKPLEDLLVSNGYEACSISYPSTQTSIENIAARMDRLLTRARTDYAEVYVVTHSLGGIIARACMDAPERDKQTKLVMLAPPNQGARMADLLLGWWPSQYVVGAAGKQLGTGVESFITSVGKPNCTFALSRVH